MNTRTGLNAWEYKRLRYKSLAFSLVVAAFILAILYLGILLGVQVADEGMSPTLASGDVLVFSRVSKYMHAPRRGQICLFLREEQLCLGRVVGLPGETIQFEDGSVFINGMYLDESAYVQGNITGLAPLTLEKNTYFVLPDNRLALSSPDTASLAVHVDSIRAMALMRVSPFTRVSLF